MSNPNSLCDEVLSQIRPLIESVVNDVQIRALEDSTLAVIRDRSVAATTLDTLVERAEFSVNMLVPHSRDALPVADAALRGLAARRPGGARVQILAAPEVAADHRLARLGGLTERVEVRLAADVRHAAVVVDGQVALVRSPGVVTARRRGLRHPGARRRQGPPRHHDDRVAPGRPAGEVPTAPGMPQRGLRGADPATAQRRLHGRGGGPGTRHVRAHLSPESRRHHAPPRCTLAIPGRGACIQHGVVTTISHRCVRKYRCRQQPVSWNRESPQRMAIS